jgi:DNA-binding transcriptional LysR family regulator
MEIRNLKSFQKICELGSFSMAAEDLGYSQSTVTMQIKQLEEELEVRLFDRIGRAVRLTEDGRLFLTYANEIIAASENAREALKHQKAPRGELRLGILESLCTSYLPDILKEYHGLYPEVSTIIRTGTYDELSLLLSTNAIDLLWTFDTELFSEDWLKTYSYYDAICIVCSPDHPLSDREDLSLSDLANQTFLLTEVNCSYRALFEKELYSYRPHPDIFLEIGNTDIIKKFLIAGLGISVLPRFTVAQELKEGRLLRLRIQDFELKMQGQIFYHKSKWVTPAMEEFIRLARKYVSFSQE